MSAAPQNLLTTLSHWASSQTENFTTDAFIHLLNHLVTYQPGEAKKLLDLLTGSCLSLSDTPAQIEIKTQEHINGLIPDITISYPGFYGIVEVKVDSPESGDQLARYREILSSHKNCKTFITFLGRYAYTDTQNQPDKTVRWYEIANHLETTNTETLDPVSAYLIRQFLQYLGALDLVLLKANSEISIGLRSFEEKYGMSIPKKHPFLRSLNLLQSYPELDPLYTLLSLMQKAAKNVKLKARLGAMEKSNWIGYSLDNMDFFFIIYLNHPEALSFETYSFPFDKTLWENSSFRDTGIYQPDPKLDIRGWRTSLELTEEFFSATKEDQLEAIEKFLQDCLAIARQFRKSVV